MTIAEEGEMKVCRIFAGGQSGKVSSSTFHYLVADGDRVNYFTETHDFGLFTEDEMRAAFEAVGLSVEFDPVGLENRSLYIGTKPGVKLI
jgi:hypothetical protein